MTSRRTRKGRERELAIKLVAEVQSLRDERAKLLHRIEELKRSPERRKLPADARIARSTTLVVGERRDRDIDREIIPRVSETLRAVLQSHIKAGTFNEAMSDALVKQLKSAIADLARSGCFERTEGHGMSAKIDLGFFADGRPGELFVRPDRAERGDVVGTLCNWGATMVSLLFQYGVPSEAVVSKMELVHDVTEGWQKTTSGESHRVNSFLDALAKWMRNAIADRAWIETARQRSLDEGLLKLEGQ